MTHDETINNLVWRLETYRRTLRTLLQQHAGYGTLNLPSNIVNQIYATRAEIQPIKAALRNLGQLVEDLPDDDPTAQGHAMPAAAFDDRDDS